MTDFNDYTLMPFGKHKGEQLGNVPDDYLIWLYNNHKLDKRLSKYIEESFPKEKLKIKKEE